MHYPKDSEEQVLTSICINSSAIVAVNVIGGLLEPARGYLTSICIPKQIDDGAALIKGMKNKVNKKSKKKRS